MKIKFIAIYILAGAAFLGVSLWVFLSNGKNARALRAKYKLGGIMLTAWTMFSSAACEGVVPQVTCYEPAEPQIMCYDVPMETDIVSVSVKDKESLDIKPGEILQIKLESPTYKEYECRIFSGESTEGTLLQKAPYTVQEDAATLEFELKLGTMEYKGPALVTLYGFYTNEEGERFEYLLSRTHTITIR